MRKLSAVVVALLVAAPLAAQPRPIAATTIVTTNTGVVSVCVGANTINAPSTCLGGLQAGPVVVNQAITLPSFTPASTVDRLYNVGGTLTWAGSPVAVGGAVGPGTVGAIPVFTGVNSIGNSLFSQSGTVMTLAGTLVSTVQGQSSFTTAAAGQESVVITNTAAGIANSARLAVASNTVTAVLDSYSSTFTTSGASRQSGSLLSTNGSDGLGLSASAGPLRFYAGSATQRGQVTSAGIFDWQTFGAHQFTGSGSGFQLLTVQNTSAGAGNAGIVAAASDTVTTFVNALSSTWVTSGPNVQGGSTLDGNGIGGLSLAATHASGTVRIYTGGGTERASYGSGGNYTLGSGNITDSVATPTITSGFGTSPSIAGRNFAFRITTGASGSPTTGVVSFNITYATAPVCTASNSATSANVTVQTSTGGVTLSTSTAWSGLEVLYVICRGI